MPGHLLSKSRDPASFKSNGYDFPFEVQGDNWADHMGMVEGMVAEPGLSLTKPQLELLLQHHDDDVLDVILDIKSFFEDEK